MFNMEFVFSKASRMYLFCSMSSLPSERIGLVFLIKSKMAPNARDILRSLSTAPQNRSSISER